MPHVDSTSTWKERVPGHHSTSLCCVDVDSMHSCSLLSCAAAGLHSAERDSVAPACSDRPRFPFP